MTCGGIMTKTEYKLPVGQTLMLRVYDGGCLWCSFVNEFTTCSRDIHHHVSDDTLPHRAINRIKTAMQMGGTLVASRCGSTYKYITLRMGFIGEAWFFAWQIRGFLFCFCLIQIDLSDAVCVRVYKKKTEYKLPVGKLSCFEFMMVDVSDALTWTRFTTCSRDIHHHVSDDTLPHRAINRIKTAIQMSGT